MEHTPTVPLDAAEPGVDPRVAAALALLATLEERPVTEHPQIYADAHDQLRAALTAADQESGDGA